MKKNKFYIFMIVLAVICAAALIYWEHNQQREVSAVEFIPEEITAEEILFPSPDNTLYQMDLYLDIGNRMLYGKSLITTVNSSGDILKELNFTVYPNVFNDARETPAPGSAYYSGFNEGWLQVDGLTVNDQNLNFTMDKANLRIELSEGINKDESINIWMQWKAKIPQVEYRYGSKGSVFMLGNFYPTLNMLDENGWHNSYNSMFGDPFCFNSANYLVRMNKPQEYQIISTGDITNRVAEDNGRDIAMIQAHSVRDFCLFVAYDYTEIKKIISGVEVKCYFPRGQGENKEEIVERTGKIIDYYSSSFASYPYQDFKVVFVPMKGFHGMEYSGMTYLQEDFLHAGSNTVHRDFVLAHEIAHQWWYSLVGNDQLAEPWLDEGLANWSAHKYLQDVEGRTIKSNCRYKGQVNLGKELRDMYSAQDYYSTAYYAGESFWFGLEEELGSDVVIKVLRSYIANYRNDIATTSDLMNVIKKEAKRDMDDYFYQWFPDEFDNSVSKL